MNSKTVSIDYNYKGENKIRIAGPLSITSAYFLLYTAVRIYITNGENVKYKIIFLIIIVIIIPNIAGNVCAFDRENPSLYSFAEVVQKIPDLWLKHPAEIMELMNQYPDFECWRQYDIVGCRSVNNKYSAEITVNYHFSSEDDSAELTHAVFMMPVNNTEEVQRVLENFWINGQKAANISGTNAPNDQVTLYFSTENTLITYNIEWGTNGVWLIYVEFGLIRG